MTMTQPHAPDPRDDADDPAPNPHATPEQVEAARNDPKLANVLYHDWEAGSYDEKWSISYDERCIDYAAGRFELVAARDGWPYGHALELGSGTGFFLLNLIQGGVAKRGSVTDLSPGMVQVALRNAAGLGLDVDGRVADAERIPYDDDTFDLVVGHAVLHHIPDLDAMFREVLRVLRPGGLLVANDSVGRDELAAFHVDDTYNPVEPGTFLTRLQTLGYERITIGVDKGLTFTAHCPAERTSG